MPTTGLPLLFMLYLISSVLQVGSSAYGILPCLVLADNPSETCLQACAPRTSPYKANVYMRLTTLTSIPGCRTNQCLLPRPPDQLLFLQNQQVKPCGRKCQPGDHIAGARTTVCDQLSKHCQVVRACNFLFAFHVRASVLAAGTQ